MTDEADNSAPAEPAESVEDRLMGLLGSDEETPEPQSSESAPADEADDPDTPSEDDEAEEPAPDDDTPDSETEEPESPPLYRVRVDGQELEVPLPELIAGYSRQADYTRKTTEVAAQRKALEAKEAEIGVALNQYAERLAAVERVITESAPAEPDWEKLRQENPAEYAAQREEYRQRKESLVALKAEQDQVRAAQERKFHEQRSAYIKAQEEALLTAIPEWQDQEKAAPEKAKLVEYAASLGMDADYLDNVTDHRFVLLLRKAMLYDGVQTAGKKAVQEKVKTAKVLPPGGRVAGPKKSERTEMQRAREKLTRTGSTKDGASLIERMLPG